MLNNKKVTLSEILQDFNDGLMNKQAEEEAAAVPAQKVCEVCGGNPCECVDDPYAGEQQVCGPEGCPPGAPSDETAGLQSAAATVSAKQEEAVDAAKALRAMADNYIAKHARSMEQEAELFGEIFAKSAMLHMNGMADDYGAYDYSDYYMDKQAAEEAFADAYDYALSKLAAEAAYADAVSSGATREQAELAAAQAVSDAAAAAKALVEHVKSAPSPEAVAGQAASEAYQQTMQQMGAGAGMEQQPTPEQEAAMGAYDETMQQMQGGAPQMDPAAMPQASNNAYNVAMQQLAQQQQ